METTKQNLQDLLGEEALLFALDTPGKRKTKHQRKMDELNYLQQRIGCLMVVMSAGIKTENAVGSSFDYLIREDYNRMELEEKMMKLLRML